MLVVHCLCEKRPFWYLQKPVYIPISKGSISLRMEACLRLPTNPKSGCRLAQLNDVILNPMNVRFVFDVLNSNVATPYRFRYLI